MLKPLARPQAGISLGRLVPPRFKSRAWRDYWRNPLARFGTWVIAALLLMALLAPLLAPYDPEAIDYFNAQQPPNVGHWLGTDPLGRDTLSRLLFAARVSLTVGLGVSLLSVTFGWLV